MLRSISSRCFYRPCQQETDRPCLGYIRGDRFSLQIDAGASPAHYADFQRDLRGASLPEAGFLALTHSHWDHTYGLCAAGSVSFACSATQAHLSAMAQWSWTDAAMRERVRTGEEMAFCDEHIRLEYSDPAAIRVRTADCTFAETLTLDLGGVTAQFIRLPNSHTDDCTIVYVPEEKVVFLGDITCDDMAHRPPCIHRSRYEALRTALTALDFSLALDGHCPDVLTKAQILADFDEGYRQGLLILE